MNEIDFGIYDVIDDGVNIYYKENDDGGGTIISGEVFGEINEYCYDGVVVNVVEGSVAA